MNDIIIALAKAAILVALNQPDSFDLPKALHDYPKLKENAAVFVTVNKGSNNQLRGCIGTLEAYRPLYKDIISNAQSAALHDKRFKPLQVDELKDINLEVSVLSKPKVLSYKNSADLKMKIKPFQDGIILKLNKKRATYLPSVWEQLNSFEDFFASLCLKANLETDCLEKHPEIFVYSVTKYKESL